MRTNALLNYFVLFGALFLLLLFTFRSRWSKLKGIVFLACGAIWLLCGAGVLVKYVRNQAFFDAVKTGDLHKVESLIAMHPSLIRSRTIGIWHDDTALHLASARGDPQIVALLIRDGADVNAKDSGGITPLHEAALRGDPSVVEVLLNTGADPNAVGGRGGFTPLDLAALHGNVDAIRILLAHGANRNLRDENGKTALDYAEEGHNTNAVTILNSAAGHK